MAVEDTCRAGTYYGYNVVIVTDELQQLVKSGKTQH